MPTTPQPDAPVRPPFSWPSHVSTWWRLYLYIFLHLSLFTFWHFHNGLVAAVVAVALLVVVVVSCIFHIFGVRHFAAHFFHYFPANLLAVVFVQAVYIYARVGQ